MPWPRKNVPPLPVNRSTATLSSQSSVASALIRAATGAQSGCTCELPAMPGIRRPSASRSAARIIILDGTHPQYGHSPPTSLASTPATARPASARRLGGILAAGTHADDDNVHHVLGHPPSSGASVGGPRI